MTYSLRDKVVIITGASSGIGAALAEQLGAMGAKIVLAARREERLQEIAAKHPTHSLVVPTDVTDESACKNLIERTIEKFGRLDVLINNAGMSMWTGFAQLEDISVFEKLMRLNYLGSVYCTYHALPHIKQSKGQFVAVSSLAGKNGVPFRTAYCGSKHAMNGFFDSLRAEVKQDGVSVLIACPDFVESEIRHVAFGSDGKPFGSDPMAHEGIMTAEECARQIITGMEKRKRELLMSSRGKLIPIGKILLPNLIDNLAIKATGWPDKGQRK